jgi:hypothetical protein
MMGRLMMMMVAAVVKASHPGITGKGLGWDSRDKRYADNNWGGNQDDGSKRHFKSSLAHHSVWATLLATLA